MKVELESKYEVGDKVYIFKSEDYLYEIIKIKFEENNTRFAYLLENENGERTWYIESQVHKSIDK